MGRLEGKVAIITGGAGGIGRAAGELYAAEGADVLLVDLDEASLREACSSIASNKVSYFVGDITRAADNQAMVACAEQRYGGVDVFVANAGIEGAVCPLVDVDEAQYDRVMEVNVKGVFLGMQCTIPAMQKRGSGSIVITSSVAGVGAAPLLSPYCASKHAVIGLMRSAAKEYASDNIRINTVNPSPVETRMMRTLESGYGGDPSAEGMAAAKENMAANIPMQRYGNPEEIAKVMLFLASDDSSWVTGSVNMADGGMTA
jgi:NAD(P)-dependent dehydrogenase (short-subunit alcohol dehydrogenase family)